MTETLKKPNRAERRKNMGAERERQQVEREEAMRNDPDYIINLELCAKLRRANERVEELKATRPKAWWPKAWRAEAAHA